MYCCGIQSKVAAFDGRHVLLRYFRSEGELLLREPSFFAGLEQKLKEASAKQPQPEFHIRPDKASKYEYTAAVMASAQRLGVTKIGIVGSEQFIEQ